MLENWNAPPHQILLKFLHIFRSSVFFSVETIDFVKMPVNILYISNENKIKKIIKILARISAWFDFFFKGWIIIENWKSFFGAKQIGKLCSFLKVDNNLKSKVIQGGRGVLSENGRGHFEKWPNSKICLVFISHLPSNILKRYGSNGGPLFQIKNRALDQDWRDGVFGNFIVFG